MPKTCDMMVFVVCGLILICFDVSEWIYFKSINAKSEIPFHYFIWRYFNQKSIMMHIEVFLCNKTCWSSFYLWIVWYFDDLNVLVSTRENIKKQVAEHWPKNSFELNTLWIIGNCNICIDWVCLGQMRWHEVKSYDEIANEVLFLIKDCFH